MAVNLAVPFLLKARVAQTMGAGPAKGLADMASIGAKAGRWMATRMTAETGMDWIEESVPGGVTGGAAMDVQKVRPRYGL